MQLSQALACCTVQPAPLGHKQFCPSCPAPLLPPRLPACRTWPPQPWPHAPCYSTSANTGVRSATENQALFALMWKNTTLGAFRSLMTPLSCRFWGFADAMRGQIRARNRCCTPDAAAAGPSAVAVGHWFRHDVSLWHERGILYAVLAGLSGYANHLWLISDPDSQPWQMSGRTGTKTRMTGRPGSGDLVQKSRFLYVKRALGGVKLSRGDIKSTGESDPLDLFHSGIRHRRLMQRTRQY